MWGVMWGVMRYVYVAYGMCGSVASATLVAAMRLLARAVMPGSVTNAEAVRARALLCADP